VHTDKLWGGSLTAIRIDVLRQVTTLTIEVTERGQTQRHDLDLVGLTELRLFNAIEGPWERAEVTELHLRQSPSSGQFQFDVMLWSEAAGLTGTCAAVTLDGEAVALPVSDPIASD
jgi:hypothetical protein